MVIFQRTPDLIGKAIFHTATASAPGADARLREILHLRWDCVDFKRGMLPLSTSKTGKRSVVLNGRALAVLNALEGFVTPRVGLPLSGFSRTHRWWRPR
jgi:integrase